MWGWGRCRVFGLAGLAGYLGAGFGLCLGFLVAGCFLHSGASIRDAGFFVLVFVLLVILMFTVVCKGYPVDALVPGADEGRGGSRYASGSRRAGF